MNALSTPNLIALLSFAGIASGVGALLLAARDLFGRRDPQREIQSLRRLPTIGEQEPAGAIARFDLWLERTLYWSGWGVSPAAAGLLVLLVVLAVSGGVFVATENEMFSAVAGLSGVAIVASTLIVATRRRLRQFEDQFPASLDLLARGVRAGESIEQAMGVVGEAMRDPVGTEFSRCARQLQLGLSLPACMRAFSRRAGLMDVRIFANALAVHREAGGDLPTTLERLSEVIRDRMAYQRQLKSVTAAGRFSASLIALAGPILFAYLFLIQPEYGGKLTGDSIGRAMLVVAIVCEIIGLFWIFRIMKTDY